MKILSGIGMLIILNFWLRSCFIVGWNAYLVPLQLIVQWALTNIEIHKKANNISNSCLLHYCWLPRQHYVKFQDLMLHWITYIFRVKEMKGSQSGFRIVSFQTIFGGAWNNTSRESCLFFCKTQGHLWVFLTLRPFLTGRWPLPSDDHRVK